MFNFKSRKPPQKNFEDLSIEEILDRNNSSFYTLNLSETFNAIGKCRNASDVAKLYRAAYLSSTERPFIGEEILNPLHLELTKKLSVLIKSKTSDLTTKLREFKELYQLLGIAWVNRENSEERVFLRKRIEVEWKIVAKQEFTTIKEKGLSATGPYEILFYLCHPNDDLRFEIAETINKMSV